jgi:hypothetical protein
MPDGEHPSDERERGAPAPVELATVIAFTAVAVVYLLWVGAAWRFGFAGLAAFTAISAPILIALWFFCRAPR